MKQKFLKGVISDIQFNKYNSNEGSFLITFTINDNKVSVLPSLDLIPDFILPNWVIKGEKKEILLPVYNRWGELYCYENEFWEVIRNK